MRHESCQLLAEADELGGAVIEAFAGRLQRMRLPERSGGAVLLRNVEEVIARIVFHLLLHAAPGFAVISVQ